MQFNYQIRVGDLNYGNHLAHDKLITLLHDATCSFLAHLGHSEMDFMGMGLILSEIQVKYLNQGSLHDNISVNITLSSYSHIKMLFKYTVVNNETNATIATATADRIFFNYETQRIHKFDKAILAPLLDEHLAT